MSRVFFTDRDLGKRFPAILADAGLSVERHSDHFPPDCPDSVWLRDVALRGWVAITHNKRIRYTPNELAAVMEHRVALLVVVGSAHPRRREVGAARVPVAVRVAKQADIPPCHSGADSRRLFGSRVEFELDTRNLTAQSTCDRDDSILSGILITRARPWPPQWQRCHLRGPSETRSPAG